MAGGALGGGRPLLDILTVPGGPKAPYYLLLLYRTQPNSNSQLSQLKCVYTLRPVVRPACRNVFNIHSIKRAPRRLPQRHRIDKYLDTLLANQPISDGEATDQRQKVTSQDGGLPELIVARSCLTNHSEAASLTCRLL